MFLRESKDVKIENIIPIPKFVIKCKLFSPFGKYLMNTKIFINVCENKRIPLNNNDLINENETGNGKFNKFKIFELISKGQWEIPILTSPNLREINDKNGNLSILIDCVINEKYMNWCLINNEMKEILIQWCFDAIEFYFNGIIINRDSMKLPKREKMGDVEEIELDVEHLKEIGKELEELNKDIFIEDKQKIEVIERKEGKVEEVRKEKVKEKITIKDTISVIMERVKRQTVMGHEFEIIVKCNKNDEYVVNVINDELIIQNGEIEKKIPLPFVNIEKIKCFKINDGNNELHIFI